MSSKKLAETLSGENIPTKAQILKLAERLSVPAFAFFMEKYIIPPSEIIDFRASQHTSLKYGKDTHRFSAIVNLRNFLADLYSRLDWSPPEYLYELTLDENPEQSAAAVSQILGMQKIRQLSKDKAEFYKNFRLATESLGVFVVQDHNFSSDIDGFAIYHANFSSNLIFVNSAKRNHGAKSFTIAHELSHIFGKRSAITDNYHYDNDIEIFANEFAASLLIPRDELIEQIELRRSSFINYEWSIKSATKLSDHFKCSISAVLVRLAKFGYVKQDVPRQFIAGFGGKGFADGVKPEGHGGKNGPAPGVIDLAYLGARAVSVITSALEAKLTTPYEVFENTGLSKKRIEGLLTVAAERELIKEKSHAIIA